MLVSPDLGGMAGRGVTWLPGASGLLHCYQRRQPPVHGVDARWEAYCGELGTEAEAYTDGTERCVRCRVLAERAWIRR